MKQKLQKHAWDIAVVLLIAFLISLPALFKDLVPVAHDTIFHISRIEQLSRSIQDGNWLPAMDPYVNVGYGYASPLFYSDFFLLPAAFLHVAGVPLSVCFRILLIGAIFFSTVTMYHCAGTITKNRALTIFATMGYMFANYHITDIYVRNALGEIFAFTFLPMMLEGMYRILWNDEKKWGILAAGLAGLALSHNITFLMGVVLCVLFFLIQIRTMTKEKFFTLCKGVLCAFLLTAFFTLPMMEQMASQKFNLSNPQNLYAGSFNWWQFFTNQTIFGFSGNDLTPAKTMTVNVGWFLTFAPLLYIFLDHHKKEHPFVTVSCIIGYVTMLLPSKIIPWSSLTFLNFMQFPWRFNTIAVLCLSLPAAYGILCIATKKFWILFAEVCLCIEAVFHVLPAYFRNVVGFTSSTTWEDVKQGAVLDPWYGATYYFIEMAGADYLPVNSPNFHTMERAIRDADQNALNISFEQNGSVLSFTAEDESTDYFVLPLTYYKGYQVTKVDGDTTIQVETFETANGLVACKNDGSGQYICRYEDTPIRKASLITSFVTLLLLGAGAIYRHKKNTKEDPA